MNGNKNIYLNASKFNNLKQNTVLNICEFMGNDFEIFFNLNRKIKKQFLNILLEKSKNILDQFIIYKEILIKNNCLFTITKKLDQNSKSKFFLIKTI